MRSHSLFHDQLAVLYAAQGQIEPMTEHLLAGLRGAPPRPSAENAIADRPNDPRLAATLGLLLRTQGRTEDALRVLARAYAQTPADPGLAYQYAETLATSGDPAAARTVLGRIARMPFPEQTQAQALRERLRE